MTTPITVIKNTSDILSGNFKPVKLADEILEKISKLVTLYVENNNINMIFNDNLTSEESSIIDNLVANHNSEKNIKSFFGVPIYIWNYHNLSGIKISKKNIWFQFSTFPFLGTNVYEPKKIILTYRLEDPDYSGNMRIIDYKTNLEICNFELLKGESNSSDGQIFVHDYDGDFNNLSRDLSIWDIRFQRESSSNKRDLFILSINILI